MARPKKATVDYFPHMTEHGSTLFILQNRWGNDGYAAWFKILERIGSTDGLYIDCRKSGTWHFLQAYTNVTGNVLTEILDTVAELGKIDKSLWSHKIIFCQNFVDGVVDAFRKRLNTLPTRSAVFISCDLTPFEFPAEETPLNDIKDTKTEQSAAGSTERERERERERETIEPSSEPKKMTIKEFSTFYYQTFSQLMPGGLNYDASQIVNRYPHGTITDAFTITALHGGSNFAYLKAVLENKGKEKPYGKGRVTDERKPGFSDDLTEEFLSHGSGSV